MDKQIEPVKQADPQPIDWESQDEKYWLSLADPDTLETAKWAVENYPRLTLWKAIRDVLRHG